MAFYKNSKKDIFNMTALAPTLTNRFIPNTAAWVRDLFLILTGSWLVALFAQVEIPLQPVPITGQTFAVLLVGALLGSKRGAAAMIAYIAQGGLGLPFFAGGAAGMGILTGATAGYLLGFVGAAYAVGWLAERGLERSVRTSILPFLVGTVIIYVFGVAWLSILLGSLSKALQFGMLPFVMGDLVKLGAAALILPGAWKFVK
jgi:biotin transport system substrate-specific component